MLFAVPYEEYIALGFALARPTRASRVNQLGSEHINFTNGVEIAHVGGLTKARRKWRAPTAGFPARWGITVSTALQVNGTVRSGTKT